MNQRIISKNFLITILCLFAVGSCMNPIQQANSLTIPDNQGAALDIN